jgi:hypothetical protein
VSNLRQHRSSNCSKQVTNRPSSLPIRSTRQVEKPLQEPPTQQPLPEFRATKITLPKLASDTPAFTEIRRRIWYPEDWPKKRPSYWPREWPYPADPTLRKLSTDGECCSDSVLNCKCYRNILSSTHQRIKIGHCGEKGWGARAKTKIPADIDLGELVGRIRPRSSEFDKRWGAEIVRGVTKNKFGAEYEEILGIIDCENERNWVGFVNHGCGKKANACLYCYWFGHKFRIMLKTTRIIFAGEKILADYGPDYWRNLKCYCGDENCYNPANMNPVRQSTYQAERQIPVSHLNCCVHRATLLIG